MNKKRKKVKKVRKLRNYKLIINKIMRRIKKKIWPEYFELVKSGKKKFELRLADFDIEEGDILVLQEYDPKKKEYTGREIEVKAKYILRHDINKFGQAEEVKEKGLYVIQF